MNLCLCSVHELSLYEVFVFFSLYDEKDITLKGLEAIQNADVIYVEFYTSPLGGKTIEEMEQMYGKRIFVLEQSDIEETAEA